MASQAPAEEAQIDQQNRSPQYSDRDQMKDFDEREQPGRVMDPLSDWRMLQPACEFNEHVFVVSPCKAAVFTPEENTRSSAPWRRSGTRAKWKRSPPLWRAREW